MPDFEELMKLTEDGTKEQDREQEITKIRETHSRQDKRDAERTKRFVQGPLSRRWSRRMNLDETYRTPSLFTWRF
jgi:hypothetical protein